MDGAEGVGEPELAQAGHDADLGGVPALPAAHVDVVPPSGPDGDGADREDQGAVYLPYFDMEVVFDDSRLRAAAARVLRRLMDYAEATRWGKRQMTREEARERVTSPAAAA